LTSTPLDLLVAVSRGGGRKKTLGRQLEDQLRTRIRDGSLRPGSRLPSTRDLAGELGVSRPIVVEAYAQLASEGYIVVRQGSRPHVCEQMRPSAGPTRHTEAAVREPRIDFRPGIPDLSAFPRGAWLRATRDALRAMPDAALGYTDPHGALDLRLALSDYLARVRGVVSDPSRVLITSGWAQGRTLLLRALKASGAKRIAVEDPCFVDAWESVKRLGLEFLPIPVDDDGISIEALERARPDAVVVTPAHQYPSGAVLTGPRRSALIEWVRRTDATIVEDDYDAEYRYDRAPVGALQSLDPARIVYAGTASKTLAPALRLGWLVVPPRLLAKVKDEHTFSDFGGPRIEQHTFAQFVASGELDRHLRRMRGVYRARRDALVAAVEKWMPEATVCGIAAGLHAVVRLPAGFNERAVVAAAERQGIAFTVLGAYELTKRKRAASLILGYARNSEAVIEAGIRELAVLVGRAAR
jgi:GntR family transcriptional regulator/MocR family aminotransferase